MFSSLCWDTEWKRKKMPLPQLPQPAVWASILPAEGRLASFFPLHVPVFRCSGVPCSTVHIVLVFLAVPTYPRLPMTNASKWLERERVLVVEKETELIFAAKSSSFSLSCQAEPVLTQPSSHADGQCPWDLMRIAEDVSISWWLGFSTKQPLFFFSSVLKTVAICL